MLSHVLTFYEGDREVIMNHVESLRKKTPRELVNLYNKEQKCGIVGVHAQALYLYAMRKVFLEMFDESPIKLDDIVLDLSSPIELKDGKIQSIEKKPLVKDVDVTTNPIRELEEVEAVKFVDQPVLSFVFFCLVVRIDSIYYLHGDPVTFIEEHIPWGTMNKDLVTFVSMSYPGQEIGRITEEVLKPAGFIYNKDYAAIQEDYPAVKKNHVYLPNVSCRDIPWLGSVVTDGGNFIWCR
ncbi:hypothetical protein ACFLT1_08510 [Bacteroidota bacterium]